MIMSKVQTKDNYLSKDRPGGKEIAKDYQVQTDCSNLESESIGQVSKAEYDNARVLPPRHFQNR